MPSLSNQGPRPLAPTELAAAPQSAARPVADTTSAVAENGRASAIVDQDNSVRLSARALSDGAALGAASDSMAVARQFMQRMAEGIFGGAGEGASFDFGAIALEGAAGFVASTSYASAAQGATSTTALALTQSAHVIGTGQLTLADGKVYDFEIEVKYQAAASVSTTENAPQQATPDMILAGIQLPAIRYPGGIDDLFKLLGREVSTDQGDPGKLMLRLIRLVDRAALLAPRLPAEDAPGTSAARQSAASAYANAGAADA